jgi:hypothetical protein
MPMASEDDFPEADGDYDEPEYEDYDDDDDDEEDDYEDEDSDVSRHDIMPKRPACTYCGSKGGKKHAGNCRRPQKA